jgi:hypothetical protein
MEAARAALVFPDQLQHLGFGDHDRFATEIDRQRLHLVSAGTIEVPEDPVEVRRRRRDAVLFVERIGRELRRRRIQELLAVHFQAVLHLVRELADLALEVRRIAVALQFVLGRLGVPPVVEVGQDEDLGVRVVGEHADPAFDGVALRVAFGDEYPRLGLVGVAILGGLQAADARRFVVAERVVASFAAQRLRGIFVTRGSPAVGEREDERER